MSKPRIVITLDGGLVQDVLCDFPADVTIIDYDTEGSCREDLSPIHQTDESEDELAYVHKQRAIHKPERITEMLRNVK